MAISVAVPKNLSGIKTKVAMNLTKRQLGTHDIVIEKKVRSPRRIRNSTCDGKHPVVIRTAMVLTVYLRVLGMMAASASSMFT